MIETIKNFLKKVELSRCGCWESRKEIRLKPRYQQKARKYNSCKQYWLVFS